MDGSSFSRGIIKHDSHLGMMVERVEEAGRSERSHEPLAFRRDGCILLQDEANWFLNVGRRRGGRDIRRSAPQRASFRPTRTRDVDLFREE